MEITWQEGRLDDKCSKSHSDADSHPEAELFQEGNSHPEVDVHPEVNSHQEAGSHPRVDLHSEVNLHPLVDAELHPEAKAHLTASTRVRLHNVRKCQLLFRVCCAE